jgi:hypothetical protein
MDRQTGGDASNRYISASGSYIPYQCREEGGGEFAKHRDVCSRAGQRPCEGCFRGTAALGAAGCHICRASGSRGRVRWLHAGAGEGPAPGGAPVPRGTRARMPPSRVRGLPARISHPGGREAGLPRSAGQAGRGSGRRYAGARGGESCRQMSGRWPLGKFRSARNLAAELRPPRAILRARRAAGLCGEPSRFPANGYAFAAASLLSQRLHALPPQPSALCTIRARLHTGRGDPAVWPFASLCAYGVLASTCSRLISGDRTESYLLCVITRSAYREDGRHCRSGCWLGVPRR